MVLHGPQMALRQMIRWAQTEWGIFSKSAEMGVGERVRWLRQWVPFGIRTIGYGTLSVTVGPFTKGAASTWAARQWSRVSARGLNISIDCAGLDNVPEGGLVYCSNHQSLIDILVLGATLPGDFKWAAKRSVMNVPFLGWHLRLAGHVPVDRSRGKEAAMAALEAFETVLSEEKPLLVFPEGTRSADGKLKAFKSGAFLAAVRAARPVVPVALHGTYALMSRDSVDTGNLRNIDGSRLVLVRVGKPLFPDAELGEADRIADLRDRTRASIAAMLSDIAGETTISEVSPSEASSAR